jgi:hypothetical protein
MQHAGVSIQNWECHFAEPVSIAQEQPPLTHVQPVWKLQSLGLATISCTWPETSGASCAAAPFSVPPMFGLSGVPDDSALGLVLG